MRLPPALLLAAPLALAACAPPRLVFDEPAGSREPQALAYVRSVADFDAIAAKHPEMCLRGRGGVVGCFLSFTSEPSNVPPEDVPPELRGARYYGAVRIDDARLCGVTGGGSIGAGGERLPAEISVIPRPWGAGGPDPTRFDVAPETWKEQAAQACLAVTG